MFSRACEYAIKIMIHLAKKEKEGARIGLKEITKAIESPEAFTAKVLQQLVKHQLLGSFKGPTGGFALIKGKEIRLIDIVKAIDGNKLLDKCVLGFESCSAEKPCPVHHSFVQIREQLSQTLLSIEIRDNRFS